MYEPTIINAIVIFVICLLLLIYYKIMTNLLDTVNVSDEIYIMLWCIQFIIPFVLYMIFRKIKYGNIKFGGDPLSKN